VVDLDGRLAATYDVVYLVGSANAAWTAEGGCWPSRRCL
jgi:hypothetical protein